jgi:SAM-dependent methyltransferase
VVATIRNVLHGTRLFSHSPARELADDPFTQRARAIWTAGDYDRVSRGFRHEAEVFVDRLGLTPADNVLDAACGNGNLTIPAARTGARVTALDLVPTLLEATAGRAFREGLDITLDEGTVERLPYEKGEFDVVMSMFGVMFAARPDRVVAELGRVTRPGGRVALANWTPDGFVGRMLAMHVDYVPPPSDLPSPLLWGDESVIYKRFDSASWNVKTRVRTLTFRYPYTPGGTAKLFRTSYGPTVRTFEALDNDRRGQLAADLLDHWIDNQRPGKRITEVDSEYLEVVAIRR